MSKTLRELEAKRATYVVQLDVQDNDLRRTRDKFIEDERIILSIIGDYRVEIAALDIAIAALTPAPDFEAEKAVAREQLEREPDAQLPGIDDIIDPDLTGGLKTEVYLERLHAGTLRRPDPDEQDDASEFISDLTGDPAIEPEAGLQEERPALNEQMQDEREQPVEGYAPVTNPEADALAKAHDYYSPEKVAERNRFNPFTMFRREPEGV
jgi:hypothetical protein